MKSQNESHGNFHRGKRGRPSSFWMQDSERVFEVLNLKEGETFLDLGCGVGEYALHAAKLVGAKGLVYALDKTEDRIDSLNCRAAEEGVTNIRGMVADITRPLPVESCCVDVCLVATVLHIPGVVQRAGDLFGEISRVLKPEGRLAIIDCYKKDLSFGPPEHMRLSAREVKDLLTRYGFRPHSELDLGYNYLVLCLVGR